MKPLAGNQPSAVSLLFEEDDDGGGKNHSNKEMSEKRNAERCMEHKTKKV